MVSRAKSINNHIKKNLLYYTLASILLGIVIGHVENNFFASHKSLVKNTILALAIATIYPSMVQLKAEELHLAAKRRKEITIGLAIVFVLSPLLAILLAHLFSSKSVGLGFVTSNIVPASSASLGYVLIVDGDIELATMLAIASLLGSLVAIPGYLKVYASLMSLNIPLAKIMKIVTLTLVVPLIAGQATRYYIVARSRENREEALRKLKPVLQTATAIGMIVLVFLLVAAKADIAISRPELALEIIGVQSLMLVILLGAVELIDNWLGISHERHSAMAFISATKNQSVAAAIAVTALGRAAALVPALVPIVQAPVAIAYLHLLLRRAPRYLAEEIAVERAK